MTDRERALRILERIEKKKLSAPESMARQPGMEHPEFVRMLVFGVLRWRSRLDHALGVLGKRKPEKIDPAVLQILRLGALQIWFSSVPSYAAVSESVELAAQITPRAKTFVNAVLRRVSERSLESIDPKGTSIDDISVRTSHPVWLLDRWAELWGIERAEQIARANQELSFPDLLVNTREWTPTEALEEIRSRGLEAEVSNLVDGVIRLRSATAPLDDLINTGYVYPMDEGSVAVTRLLPEGTDRVIDLCAAPGGKTLALALADHHVVASDVSFARLTIARRAWRRFFKSAPRLTVANSLELPFRETFDVVFVDAPCSATGTFRKNPEARWRLSPREITRMADLQRRILDRAIGLSSHWILYVTCSLEKEENDDVVATVVEARDDIRVRALDPFTPLQLRRWLDSGVLRLTPESGTDGFTATLLEKSG